jgi:hypothetical protein
MERTCIARIARFLLLCLFYERVCCITGSGRDLYDGVVGGWPEWFRERRWVFLLDLGVELIGERGSDAADGFIYPRGRFGFPHDVGVDIIGRSHTRPSMYITLCSRMTTCQANKYSSLSKPHIVFSFGK